MTTRENILKTIHSQRGVLFALPSIVYRENYSGRDILAKNSKFAEGYTDSRGYVPVERWIMSATNAENPKLKENEGLTILKIGEDSISFKEAITIAPNELLGPYIKTWPLTKILDIGGEPKQTSFGTLEVPPIPAHIHSGEIKDGKPIPPGKSEAYFFPPLNVPPYNKQLSNVITRLGIKPNITKQEFIDHLKKFGKDDSMYELLQEHPAEPYTGWTIPSKLIHAPGPWPTFEIQLPQDDFNLASWRLGDRLDNSNQEEVYKELCLRGLKNEEAFVEELIDWDKTTHANFRENHFRSIKIIGEGDWGRRFQIFFDQFYGEGWEITTSKTLTSKQAPIAGIVWSGKGTLNGTLIAAQENDEFLITPNTEITIQNTGDTPLMIFTVEPIKVKK